jgi:hypothetical protein
MPKQSLAAEHAELLDEQDRLTVEHRRLEQEPYDIVGHEAHRQALKEHIDRLRVHVRRLRTNRSLSD